ncbi:Leucine-rich repeat, ribonuclease inhibitor subtype [Candidatus Amoebophilus asiaticus 5a2]|uniref:Leucine-rich repeat, ribonuclease inhibitor subtype n=1 Tax=Amoebophilus asiaticus (strain 5a2) TaxID=452471 RepID=B3EUD9_AMOA5|nr:hypothetical protein [Candidatus Amoebophilus asiaticus]ACE05558.1 Leucine-rich repeat, ribonuclease inhibitor subtype [Candidatus Amoebophilus asiaticus 5a2]
MRVLAVRSVNSDWNQLITGFRVAGIIGIENKPQHIINTSGWASKKEIDFSSKKLSTLTSATIPSFAFYHLMGYVENLPQIFWPCLPATHIYTLDLNNNEIGAAGSGELAKALPATQVHTLHLGWNQIGAAGSGELAKALPATQVHTLHLEGNQIGDAGARELAKTLPSTKVHTLHLSVNRIGDAGASELAKALPATQVHTLHLRSNQIGGLGAIELAKALPATCMHTLDLQYNKIEKATQQLLLEQYPHIRWKF